MRAITQRAYGSAEVLKLEHIDRPEIDADQVLLQVVAAGLDRGVWHLMAGEPYLVRLMGYGFTKPKNSVPGLDVAGRVVAVGADVTRFGPGDEVFGIADGAFGEYAAADEAKLVHKPANVTFQTAAVATVSGITALEALTAVGHLEAGQRVLVIGASGGVGSFAVQIAKALGATVTGVASTQKLEFVRSLGADAVFDYTTGEISDIGQNFDLVVDIGGRNRLSQLRRVVTRAGTLVIVGGENGGRFTGGVGRQIRAVLLSPFVKQRLTFFVSEESRTFIDPLAQYLADGVVVPAIGQSYALDEVPEALERMEAGDLVGKAVVTVASDDPST